MVLSDDRIVRFIKQPFWLTDLVYSAIATNAYCCFCFSFAIYAYVWFGMVGWPTEENLRSSTQKETFDGSRKDINAAINRVCESTGEHVGAFGYDPHFVDCSLICCFLFLQELK